MELDDVNVLRKIVAECDRLHVLSRYTKNILAFQVMEDLRDAACLHVIWLNIYLRMLTDVVRGCIGEGLCDIVAKHATVIQSTPDAIDLSGVFLICASVSRDIKQLTLQILGQDKN